MEHTSGQNIRKMCLMEITEYLGCVTAVGDPFFCFFKYVHLTSSKRIRKDNGTETRTKGKLMGRCCTLICGMYTIFLHHFHDTRMSCRISSFTKVAPHYLQVQVVVLTGMTGRY